MVQDEGKENFIKVHETVTFSKSHLSVAGNNNSVIIEEGVQIRHCNIRIKGNNINVKIGKNVEMTGCVASIFTGCLFVIEESTTMGNGEVTVAEETSLSIGRDCMFAHGYEIRTSDMHPIYDLTTGKRLNHGAAISVGDHVWLGRNVVILKGAKIANNVVVGIHSIVSKDISTPNSIAIGSPAKVIRNEVIWGRKMYHKTMHDDPTLEKFIRNNKFDDKR